MNAPVPPPAVCVDPIAAFEAQCVCWAGRYAVGRVPLHRVTDLLEALTPFYMSADDAQRTIADAITAATASADDPGDDDDDYAGLTGSFVRLCVEQDAEYRLSPAAERDQRRRDRLTEILTALTGRAIAMCQPGHVAASTMMAAQFLIQQNDPARLKAWLLAHGKRERAAICAALNTYTPEQGDHHEQENGDAQDETAAAHASGA